MVADGVLGVLVLGVLVITDDKVIFDDDARLNFVFGMNPLDFAVVGTGVGVVGEPKSP